MLGTCLSTLAHVCLYAGNVFWTKAGNLLHFLLLSPKQFKNCNYGLMFKENHLIFPQKTNPEMPITITKFNCNFLQWLCWIQMTRNAYFRSITFLGQIVWIDNHLWRWWREKVLVWNESVARILNLSSIWFHSNLIYAFQSHLFPW